MRALPVAVLAACLLAGCGSSAPDKVSVPNLVGQTAEQAESQLQSASLSATYAQQPGDKSKCKVTAQDQTGKVAPDTTIQLTCVVEVPDVKGRQADQAQTDIEDAGLQSRFVSEPDGPTQCKVKSQDKTGEAPPTTEVSLSLKCQAPPPPQPTQSQATTTETQPPPTTDTQTSSCDPNYTGACVPVGQGDVNCADLSETNFQSVGSDPDGLDRDGDGVACESH